MTYDPQVRALQLAQSTIEAARAGEPDTLRSLLDAGVPPDIRSSRGDSLLMLASYHGHLESARLLLERGADPALANDRGQVPLSGVAFKGDLPMAELLLSHGASATHGGTGPTPRQVAERFGRAAMVALLPRHGA